MQISITKLMKGVSALLFGKNSAGELVALTANSNNQLQVETLPKYVDLGLLFDGVTEGKGLQLGAGATLYSATITDTAWVRHIVSLIKAANAATIELYIQRVDSLGNVETGSKLKAITGTGGYDSYVASPAAGINAGLLTSVLGGQFKIGIKNAGGSPVNVFMSVQLLG